MSQRDVGWLKESLREARRLNRYDPGETVESLARRLDLKPSEILRLNANENFFVPLDFLRSLLKEIVEEIDPRIYPQDERHMLEEALGRYLRVSPEQIVLGAGGDQLIELLSSAFLKRGDEVLLIQPTFSIYGRVARILGVKYLPVPLRADFSLDVKQMLSSTSPRTKILFLCSPNNPTANQFESEQVLRLIENFEGLVILDEAYAEFAQYSMTALTEEFENLVVLRTFSKAFGLAGLRLGYAVSNREIASTLNERFQMPYPTSLGALKMGLKLLERFDIIDGAIADLKKERTRLINKLNEIEGVEAFNSETNFVLVGLDQNSDELYEELLERGVIVRNVGRVLGMDNCLRAAVAPPAMTGRFLDILREVISDGKS